MANTLKLWINAETGRLVNSATSFVTAPTQTFYSGNAVELELHLIEGAGVARVPYEVPFPSGASIQVAVGTVATAPEGGQWRLSVSGTETADLAYNASASAVQTVLNAISAVSTAGGVTVTALGGGYSITWNTVGTKPAILAGSDTLTPASYEAILTLQTGDVSTREIVFVELRQTPVALADSFSAIGAPVITANTVSAWNGTNKIVRVGISPTPKGGSFTIGIGSHTAAVQAFASATTFNAAVLTAGITTVTSIVASGQDQYDIVLSADQTVTVDGSGLITSPGVTGTLSLATSELIAYLGAEASKQASLEISVTSGGQTQTLVQVGCNVANGVLSTGAVAPISVGTLLTETVANARFVRRDASQSPSGADVDMIWSNIGLVLGNGSDVIAAINSSQSPASGNQFLTKSEGDDTYLAINDPIDTSHKWMVVWNDATNTFATTADTSAGYLFQDQGSAYQADFGAFASSVGTPAIRVTEDNFTTWTELNGAGIRFPDGSQQDSAGVTVADASASYQTIAGMSAYLTTAAASSTYQTLIGMSSYLTTSAATATYVTATTAASTYLSITTAASTYLSTSNAASTYAPLTNFDQGLKTYDSVTFNSVTFGDSTSQNTRVVREQQANGSGFSTGGFDTAHYPYEVKVIDDTGTAYWVPARLA